MIRHLRQLGSVAADRDHHRKRLLPKRVKAELEPVADSQRRLTRCTLAGGRPSTRFLLGMTVCSCLS